MKYIWMVVIIAAIVGFVVWVRGGEKTPEPAIVQNESTQSAPVEENKESVTNNKKTVKNGMTIEIIKEGNGAAIANEQTAVVQYEGKLTDGRVFDSTAKHGGKPFEFQIGISRVIQGWHEGIIGMKVGETRLLTIPPELGYGPEGYPPVIPQNATLIFTVTLEGIK